MTALGRNPHLRVQIHVQGRAYPPRLDAYSNSNLDTCMTPSNGPQIIEKLTVPDEVTIDSFHLVTACCGEHVARTLDENRFLGVAPQHRALRPCFHRIFF